MQLCNLDFVKIFAITSGLSFFLLHNYLKQFEALGVHQETLD